MIFKRINIKIHTKRLVIRKIEKIDAQRMYEYRSKKEISRYQKFRPVSINETRIFLSDNTKNFNVENCWYQIGIYLVDKLIGDIGIHFIGPNNLQCELGYTIDKDYQRKGFGVEAVTAILDFIFTELKKHRVIASLDPTNEASIALLERIGFRREGQFKESIFNSGIWEDDIIYAVLSSEWQEKRGQLTIASSR